jgi:hypothetical protein
LFFTIVFQIPDRESGRAINRDSRSGSSSHDGERSRTGSASLYSLPIGGKTIREKVQDVVTGETQDIEYIKCNIVGTGSFGVVFQIKLLPSNEDAAIKRVLQDKRFKVSLLQASA